MNPRASLGATALTFLAPCLGLLLLPACAQQRASSPAPAAALHALQGEWEQKKDSGTISMTIAGDSLYFYQRPDFQYDATFTLVPDSDPAELHATILDSPRTTDSEGEQVVAIYAFEDDGALRLVVPGGSDGPLSFDQVEPLSGYRFERVRDSE